MTHPAWRSVEIEQVIRLLELLNTKVDQMAAGQAALDTALAQLNTDLTGLQAGQAALLAKLQSLQASQGVDLSKEIAQVQAVDAALGALSSQDATATNSNPTGGTASPTQSVVKTTGTAVDGAGATVALSGTEEPTSEVSVQSGSEHEIGATVVK